MPTRRSLAATAVAALVASAWLPAGASASCALVPLTDLVKISGVVATVEFLPGPSGADGSLRTPGRARVIRYDQGRGPEELDVTTSLGSPAFVSEGINPKAGETWRLYGSLAPNGSLGTSLCSGSLLLPAQSASASITAAGATRSLASATIGGRPHKGALAVVKLPRRGTVTLRATSPASDAAAAQAVTARLIEPGRAARVLRVAWSGRSATLSGKLPKLTLGKKGATLVIITREQSFAVKLRPAA